MAKNDKKHHLETFGRFLKFSKNFNFFIISAEVQHSGVQKLQRNIISGHLDVFRFFHQKIFLGPGSARAEVIFNALGPGLKIFFS